MKYSLFIHLSCPFFYRFLCQPISGQDKSIYDPKTQIPDHFALSQNYPNPFNPKTVIWYSIPSLPDGQAGNQYVSLKVYDIFGREVAALVNEKKEPGTHEVEWNSGDLSSGVYFIRMNAGNYFATKKAILMK